MQLQVVTVVTSFVVQHKLQQVPVFAVGASSGGGFALTLPSFLPLAGKGVVQGMQAALGLFHVRLLVVSVFGMQGLGWVVHAASSWSTRGQHQHDDHHQPSP